MRVLLLFLLLLPGLLVLSCTQAPQAPRGFPELAPGSYLGSLQWGAGSFSQAFYVLVEKKNYRLVLASSGGSLEEKEARYEGRRLRFQVSPGHFLELDATDKEIRDAQGKPVFWSGKIRRETKEREAEGTAFKEQERWQIAALSSIPLGAERDELRSYVVHYNKREGSPQRFESYSDLKPLLESRLHILRSRSEHLDEQLASLHDQLSKVSGQLDVAQSGSMLGRTISLEKSISQREASWLETRMHSHGPELFAYSSADIAYAQELVQLRKTIEREQNMLALSGAAPEAFIPAENLP